MQQIRYILVSAFCLLSLSARAGYTHYFTWNKSPNEADLTNCVKEMRLIVDASKNILAGPDGLTNSAVVIESTQVCLNGIGDNAHEPFVFPGDQGFNFCKTEGKPYDSVVTACLMVARDHFPSSILSIGSDGSWEAGDWQDGAKLYATILGRPARNPIDGWGLGKGLMYRLWIPLSTTAALLILIFLWNIKRKKWL